jgi:hypothetical protein
MGMSLIIIGSTFADQGGLGCDATEQICYTFIALAQHSGKFRPGRHDAAADTILRWAFEARVACGTLGVVIKEVWHHRNTERAQLLRCSACCFVNASCSDNTTKIA